MPKEKVPRPLPARRLNPPDMHYIPSLSLSRLVAQRNALPENKRRASFSEVAVPEGVSAPSLPRKGVQFSTGEGVSAPSVPRKRGQGGALSALKRALHHQSLTFGAKRKGTGLLSQTLQRALQEPSGAPPLELRFCQQPSSGRRDELTEYERKRQTHPRLRWPRLARHVVDPHSPGYDIESKADFPHSTHSKDPCVGAHDATVDDDKGFDRSLVLSVASEPPLILGVNRHGKSNKPSRTTGPTPRPAVLPRSSIHELPPSGVTSTLHAPSDAHEEHWEQLDSESSRVGTPMSASSLSLSSVAQSSRTSFFVGHSHQAHSVESQAHSLKREAKLGDCMSTCPSWIRLSCPPSGVTATLQAPSDAHEVQPDSESGVGTPMSASSLSTRCSVSHSSRTSVFGGPSDQAHSLKSKANPMKRNSVLQTKEELHSRDKAKQKDAVKKVIANMTVGKDVSALFADVVNCIQTDNIESKKLTDGSINQDQHHDPHDVGIHAHSLKSQPKLVDRKWFMRMAPISCLPSEAVSKTARRKASAAAMEGHEDGFDCGSEGGEYLTFEDWGLSDDYIESLLGAHCTSSDNKLRGLRYLNLSGNRLTDKGILKLSGYGLPEGLLSLNLASNNFGNGGRSSVAELIGRCRRLKDLDLSRNSLGDAVVEELCVTLQHTRDLEGLGLGHTKIGASSRSGVALGTFLSMHVMLKSLDLSWNTLHGTGAHALLKGLCDNGSSMSQHLRRLNLAWNRLGSGRHTNQKRRAEAEESAKLLANVFRDGDTLFHLDLSYNGFIADDCAVLAGGLRNNHTLFGIHLVGNEATLDDLGFVIPLIRDSVVASAACDVLPSIQHKKPNQQASTVEASDGDDTASQAESDFSVQEESQRSMNDFSRNLHTGLKLENRKVSATGTFARDSGSSGLSKLHLNPSLQSFEPENARTFSAQDLKMEHAWVQDSAHIQTAADWAKNDFEASQRDTTRCWICENWVEHKVTYIPGFSDDEDPMNVRSVYALFSIDGFQKPTKLRVHEESMRRNMSEMISQSSGKRQSIIHSLAAFDPNAMHVPSNKRSTSGSFEQDVRPLRRKSTLQANPCDKVAKWVGARMMPPTTEVIQVVFLVNERVIISQDMPQKALQAPKVITLQMADEQMLTVEIREVNLMSVGSSAFELFRRGRHHAVCVLEDPLNRCQTALLPRRLTEMADDVEPVVVEWTFETSTFKDYVVDTQEIVEQCFNNDWNSGRLSQILGKEETRNELCTFLRPRYLNIMMCFSNWAFSGSHGEGFDDGAQDAGVSFNSFREQMIWVGGEGPTRLIDGNYCKATDIDCIFVAANVIARDKQAQFKILPERGLARFQILEAVVRLGLRRFLNTTPNNSSTRECVSAMRKFFDLMSLGEDLRQQRKTLQDGLFVERCCLAFREHIDTLTGIYERYKTIHQYPGRSGKNISYGAWIALMSEADVITEQSSLKMCGAAFALAKEIQADITSDWRHMELSWSEFLVAIAAVVSLRPGFDKDLFPDLLDEFFTEHIDEAYSRIMSRQAGKRKVFRMLDSKMQPFANFLERVFEDADEDRSGTVDLREFVLAINNPHVNDEITRLGFDVADIDVLFKSFDRDGSGSISMEELIQGFIKMKTAMKGMEKTIAFVRKLFVEVDINNNNTLDINEFRVMFSQPSMLKKLLALGISIDDVNDLFLIVDSEGDGEVSVEEIIRGLVTLHNPHTRIVRGLRLLREVFDQGDLDGSGSLDLQEVENTLAQPELTERLHHLRLVVPDWLSLFEELDTDRSGCLDWAEIQDGMTACWSKTAQ